MMKKAHFKRPNNEDDVIKELIEKLLPQMPEVGSFDFYRFIRQSNLSETDKSMAMNLGIEIRSTLTYQLGYLTDHHDLQSDVYLTQPGMVYKKKLMNTETIFKHKILGFLFENQNYIFRAELSNKCDVSVDTLDYIIAEFNNDDAIDFSDASSKEGTDYMVKISLIGKGKYLKKHYLNEQQDAPPSVSFVDKSMHFHSEAKGNFKTGGNGNQDFEEAHPQIYPNKKVQKSTIIRILISLWDTITKNPLIAGIISILIAEILLEYFRVIHLFGWFK